MSDNMHVTAKQESVLIKFLEENKDLAIGHNVVNPGDEINPKWTNLAKKLNRIGPERTAIQWKRFWTEYKYRSKMKVLALHYLDGDADQFKCSHNEKRVLKLIGFQAQPNVQVFAQPIIQVNIKQLQDEIDTCEVDNQQLLDAITAVTKSQLLMVESQRRLNDVLQGLKDDLAVYLDRPPPSQLPLEHVKEE